TGLRTPLDEQRPQPQAQSDVPIGLHDGDRAFVAALAEVSDSVRAAGTELIRRIRARFPGYLKSYEQRRFFNAPANFWGVQIQVRKQMLKVWVRGTPDKFNTRLKIWLDRPPIYSAFKIQGPPDLDDAMRIISAAERKE